MKRAMFAPVALAALLVGAPAFGGAPDGAFGSNGHPASDLRWHFDGTRDAVAVHLKQALGKQANPFGPTADSPPGAISEDSELLGDYVPHLLGIPGPEVALDHGKYFYSGAEAHNASQEAAVITQGRGGAVLALAVLHTNYRTHPAVRVLTIMRADGKAVDPAMQATFTGWARGEIDRGNALPGARC